MSVNGAMVARSLFSSLPRFVFHRPRQRSTRQNHGAMDRHASLAGSLGGAGLIC